MIILVTDELLEDAVMNPVAVLRDLYLIGSWCTQHAGEWEYRGGGWWRLRGVAYRGKKRFNAAVLRIVIRDGV